MSAIIENKWDINYIKKCAQHKTLHTLKNDAFELPGNKNIRNLFLKFELFSLDQANLRSDSSQKLLLRPKSSSPLPAETVLQHNPHHVIFIIFPILSYPIWRHATIMRYIKPYAKPSQSNLLSRYMQIIIPYWSNTLPIKYPSL